MVTPAFTHDAAGTSATAWRNDPRWNELAAVDSSDVSWQRLIVVAAHPDDESLGAAGLTALAQRTGREVGLVLLTSGEHSHPGSATTSPTALSRRRRAESAAALEVLAPSATVTHLEIEDGAVAASENHATSRLVELVGDGRHTLIVAPWRRDGHPDHEAAGRAASAAARRTGAHLLEYPIWFWHWGRLDDAPWDAFRVVPLDEQLVDLKRRAVAAHKSQVAALSAAVGDEELLRPSFRAHFEGARELYVEEPTTDPALDDLHRELADPWGADTRWYERRKRQITTAMLPRQRYSRGLEVGCSTGALSDDLATRCDALVAVDASPTAVRQARRRLDGRPGVIVDVLDLPDQWPDGTFDLVVVSELGYFLSPAALDHLVARISDCLAPDGVVVLCHWRHEVHGWVLDGPDVHRRMTFGLNRPVAARYLDRDAEILVLCEPDRLPEPTT